MERIFAHPSLSIFEWCVLDPTLFEEYIVYTSLHISIAVAEVTDMLQGRSICSCDQFCLTTKQNTFFFSSNSWQGGGLARALQNGMAQLKASCSIFDSSPFSSSISGIYFRFPGTARPTSALCSTRTPPSLNTK